MLPLESLSFITLLMVALLISNIFQIRNEPYLGLTFVLRVLQNLYCIRKAVTELFVYVKIEEQETIKECGTIKK